MVSLSNRLVTTTLSHVPDMTCLDMAVKTKHYEFVAHSSIQMILWDVWTGNTPTKVVHPIDYIKFLFSIVFPWYIVSPKKRRGESKLNDSAWSVRGKGPCPSVAARI